MSTCITRMSDPCPCAEVRAAIRSPLPSASPRSTVEQESPQGQRSSSEHQQPAHRQGSVSSLSPLSHLGREGSLGSQAKLGSQASLGSAQHLGSLQSRMSQQSALSHHAPLGSPGGAQPQPPHLLSHQQLAQLQLQGQQQLRLLQQQPALAGSTLPLGHQTRAGSVDAALLRQQVGLGSPALVQQQARGHSLDPALLAQHGRGAFPPSSQQLYMGLLQCSHPPPPARDYQVHTPPQCLPLLPPLSDWWHRLQG